MKTVQINEYPWRHLIIDNFLNTEMYNKIIDYVMPHVDTVKDTNEFFEFCHYVDDGTPVSETFLLFDKFKDEYFDKLNVAGINFPATYYLDVRTVILPAGFKWNNIHTENIEKVLSTIIYLYPIIGDGTELYTTNLRESYVKSVEWKQNRLMSFVGQRNLKFPCTWHDYSNNQNVPRCALNVFFRNTPVTKFTEVNITNTNPWKGSFM